MVAIPLQEKEYQTPKGSSKDKNRKSRFGVKYIQDDLRRWQQQESHKTRQNIIDIKIAELLLQLRFFLKIFIWESKKKNTKSKKKKKLPNTHSFFTQLKISILLYDSLYGKKKKTE